MRIFQCCCDSSVDRQGDGGEFTAVVLRAIRNLNATLLSGRRHLKGYAFRPDDSVREPVVEEPDEKV